MNIEMQLGESIPTTSRIMSLCPSPRCEVRCEQPHAPVQVIVQIAAGRTSPNHGILKGAWALRPFRSASGHSTRRARCSTGRPAARRALYLAALCTVRSGERSLANLSRRSKLLGSQQTTRPPRLLPLGPSPKQGGASSPMLPRQRTSDQACSLRVEESEVTAEKPSCGRFCARRSCPISAGWAKRLARVLKKFSGGMREAARPLKISLSYRPMSALGFVPLFEI
ncbi:hypothetical protein BV96_02492 [Sphingomonas paucimobilis]|nr:hypothetical protein BV96_02492 [Sphingomonas paucimobilis]